MFILLPLAIWLIACGDIPKEGDGSEMVHVKMQLEYDNSTTLGPQRKYLQ
jgi:hypothetical protein